MDDSLIYQYGNYTFEVDDIWVDAADDWAGGSADIVFHYAVKDKNGYYLCDYNVWCTSLKDLINTFIELAGELDGGN